MERREQWMQEKTLEKHCLLITPSCICRYWYVTSVKNICEMFFSRTEKLHTWLARNQGRFWHILIDKSGEFIPKKIFLCFSFVCYHECNERALIKIPVNLLVLIPTSEVFYKNTVYLACEKNRHNMLQWHSYLCWQVIVRMSFTTTPLTQK